MEIVAPAGGRNAIIAAVANGADAVYLGLSEFSARAHAENFTRENLAATIEYAHLFGTKVYVAINTLIKDSELSDALSTVECALKSGADALIMQDLGLIQLTRKQYPNARLHASTQMGVHNAEGARVAKQLGLSRVVLSRETLLQDIKAIKREGVEVEFFVQGALCISFSGNCYFSSLASSYSGNRGKCMQLCRKSYELGGKRGYLLSAKDICLFDRMDELSAAGVDAFKIEGRLKSAEYVATAVDVYAHKDKYTYDEAVQKLKRAFNRGDYCRAYLDEGAKHSIVYPFAQGNIGAAAGRITSIKNNQATVSGKISSGDGLKILRNGKEVFGGGVDANGRFAVDRNVRVGDEVRKTLDASLSGECVLRTVKKLKASVNIEVGRNATAECCVGGKMLKVSGSMVEAAQSLSLTEERIKEAFQKSDGELAFEGVTVELKGDCFMPFSALNALRRDLIAAVKGEILDSYVHSQGIDGVSLDSIVKTPFVGAGRILQISSIDVLTPDILSRLDYILYSPLDYSSPIPKIDKPLLLDLPIVARGDDMTVIDEAVSSPNVYGVVANNMYALKYDKPMLLGIGMNIVNDCKIPHILSVEADKMHENENEWVYSFGYAPVMTLCHCFYDKCVNCKSAYLKDERKNSYRIVRHRVSDCYNTMLNCVPTSLFSRGVKNAVIDCRGFDPLEISRVLDCADNKVDYPNSTRGNHNKSLK